MSSPQLEPEEARVKVLSDIVIGNPATYGGHVADPKLQGKKFDQFTSHTVPDVKPDTRIVAVLGVTDSDDGLDPTDDGWFVSDFYMFHHIMQDVGSAQTWISSEEPSALVAKYKTFLHGNIFRTRKIVLDQSIIRTKQFDNIAIRPRGSLRKYFLETLASECNVARERNQPVLVLLFGHEDQKTKGVTLGDHESPARSRLTMDQFQEAVGRDVQVSLLSTACYSGGWSVYPQLNVTTLTAAGPDTESISWPKSSSMSRACGSIYASALLSTLTEEDQTVGNRILTLPPDATAVQVETYSEFCRLVYDNLLRRVDRFGMHHGITFSAQNDEWEMFWGSRVGLPLSSFQQKYDALDDWAPDVQANPDLNRDPTMTYLDDSGNYDQAIRQWEMMRELPSFAYGTVPTFARGSEQQSETTKKRSPSDISGGSTGSLRSRVAKLGMDYMDSFPGPSNAASQTMIQGKIEKCVRGTMTDEGQLLRLLRMLDFRNGQMKQADMLIKQASLKFPQGKRCSEWDFGMFAGFANPRGTTQQMYYEVVNMVLAGREIFAEPTFDQGPGWPKPVRYLAAALLASDLSREEIKAKIDEMAHLTKQVREEQLHDLLGDAEIRSKRQKLAHVLGKTLRSFSPKRRSRGYGLVPTSAGAAESAGL